MPSPDRSALRFVRALLPMGEAVAGSDGRYCTEASGRNVTLVATEVMALVSAGILVKTERGCRPTREASAWLRRRLLGTDAHAGQHRRYGRTAEGALINLAESPLARLAVAGKSDSAPFLAPHQVEAGERVRRLVERAQLRPRLVMPYDPVRTIGSGGGRPPEIADFAADARRALADIHRVLPLDCANVVLDVCGLLKGLQTVESERGWPRRSAKLVLRIGLDQLARHFGLAPVATGPDRHCIEAWVGEQAHPTIVG